MESKGPHSMAAGWRFPDLLHYISSSWESFKYPEPEVSSQSVLYLSFVLLGHLFHTKLIKNERSFSGKKDEGSCHFYQAALYLTSNLLRSEIKIAIDSNYRMS